LHEIQDKTITEICETVNHNYRTVAKCIETSEPPKYNSVVVKHFCNTIT
jgi:hypothetical protein